MKRIMLLIVLMGFHGQLLALETMYVSSRTARVYQSDNFQSQLLTKFDRNESLNVLEQKGIWVRVRNSNVTGWISRYSLTPDKPFEEKVSIFARLKSFFNTGNSRERLTLVSTAGGIRGLSDDNSDSPTTKNFGSVATMEKLFITDTELEAFLAGNDN
ncbi:MAG: hypothetical protein ACI845_002731 [Gammaproteobacteria bacterium]|jgi:hypothetical protein